MAWDCGTGNGQIAVELARHFQTVFATDISQNQIHHAVQKKNITYKVEPAEHTSFADAMFDLVTVGQAIHWFDFERFYAEVDRTLKPRGIFAVTGYPLLTIDKQTDSIIQHFYEDIVGAYWDDERKYLDEHYRTIPFPYKEIAAPKFSAVYEWSLEQFIGYLHTWSAVQHYKERNGTNPVDTILNDLKTCWNGTRTKTATFPILLRIGIKSSG